MRQRLLLGGVSGVSGLDGWASQKRIWIAAQWALVQDDESALGLIVEVTFEAHLFGNGLCFLAQFGAGRHSRQSKEPAIGEKLHCAVAPPERHFDEADATDDLLDAFVLTGRDQRAFVIHHAPDFADAVARVYWPGQIWSGDNAEKAVDGYHIVVVFREADYDFGHA